MMKLTQTLYSKKKINLYRPITDDFEILEDIVENIEHKVFVFSDILEKNPK